MDIQRKEIKPDQICCRVMYTEGYPKPQDADVLGSLWAQCDDLGELDEDCLLVAPAGATEDQVNAALEVILAEDTEAN